VQATLLLLLSREASIALPSVMRFVHMAHPAILVASNVVRAVVSHASSAVSFASFPLARDM
jgi:hypothetical protein